MRENILDRISLKRKLEKAGGGFSYLELRCSYLVLTSSSPWRKKGEQKGKWNHVNWRRMTKCQDSELVRIRKELSWFRGVNQSKESLPVCREESDTKKIIAQASHFHSEPWLKRKSQTFSTSTWTEFTSTVWLTTQQWSGRISERLMWPSQHYWKQHPWGFRITAH